tara:strand:- start:56 stop:331 length:276 start_codon:yes stop_codon:yes gene_type:complete
LSINKRQYGKHNIAIHIQRLLKQIGFTSKRIPYLIAFGLFLRAIGYFTLTSKMAEIMVGKTKKGVKLFPLNSSLNNWEIKENFVQKIRNMF